MERAHRPRPFGCGLRVTVNSVHTRTEVGQGRDIFNPYYGGLNHHEAILSEAKNLAPHSLHRSS